MGLYSRFLLFIFLAVSPAGLLAQHSSRMFVDVDYDAQLFRIKQEITYHNQTTDTLQDFVLNDWNNAFSAKNTPLAKRFSDEFVRAYHLAKDEERGNTKIYSIVDQNGRLLNWERPKKHPDIVDVQLKNPIYPGMKFKLSITYEVKIPSDRFTGYGYNDGVFNLKDWYLVPARVVNNEFVRYSNENIDDIANSICDYELTITLPKGTALTSDLYIGNKTSKGDKDEYYLIGKNRTIFNLVLEKKNSFEIFRNEVVEVTSNLRDNRVTEIQKADIVNKITHFTADNLGSYPYGKIMITQADYDRSPMYGLNQLPSFLSPFPDSFIYEIKFLKTYTNTYLKNTLKLDPRKDNWIYDGIQMYLLMKYVEENHPDKKMMGQLSNWGILQGHNLFRVDFNGQYNYLYLLMARKNLDQPIGDPKRTFIKFNEQIAGKYRSGLSFAYINNYLGNNIVPNAISEFYNLNKSGYTSREDFEQILKSKTDKDINWFFNTVVNTRKLIDFKFGDVDREKDSVRVTVKNRTGTDVPVSFYGVKDKKMLFKTWLENVTTDTTFTIARQDADRLVLNYENEIPEYNTRNNWKSLKKFSLGNKPYKFTFFQDLEDPTYNQVFYVPSFIFNLYDGFSPGFRVHNKSMLEKPFIFDVEPTYSTKTGKLIGSVSFLYNHYLREKGLYNVRYYLGGSTYHYAPDARYIKFNPSVQFRIREDDFRKNKQQYILIRQVLVNRQQSDYVITDEQNENYSVFNLRYGKYESEITRHYNFYTDAQIANSFGKLSGEIQYRRLFNDNRQINLRLFAGTFMYRSTSSEFFSFGLDRPTDYMFDYNFYGRSETTGLFSQQYVMAEGGFKSMLETRFANQWMVTTNASFNIWNWVEVYGDAGVLKNKYRSPEFLYDSGIRLNLLPDYFELYFPVYSSNGFEMNNGNYSQKIRFVVTISPGTLINLFTRKWF
ncbi:aminopeptidase [Flavobacterium sp. MK4S-17]|uniref:aminopeptidase n=1 Tax=Flavobacterium sp. MK4S-17 TaxID=2543737 RepID=UPI00351B9E10